jgi:hypothetical protein
LLPQTSIVVFSDILTAVKDRKRAAVECDEKVGLGPAVDAKPLTASGKNDADATALMAISFIAAGTRWSKQYKKYN